MLVALAIRTGIAPSVWAAEGERVIDTAIDLLRGSQPADRDTDGRQMSG